MHKTITRRDLRNDSAAVLREVQAGQTLIVTRNGRPVAELGPLQPRQYVPRPVIAAAAAEAPALAAARFRSGGDAVIDESVDG